MPLALSILDQSSVASGRTAPDAIRETLALAKLADEWGYRRYWMAEHHNSASHAGTAPEILISAIAATTRRISGGDQGKCARWQPGRRARGGLGSPAGR